MLRAAACAAEPAPSSAPATCASATCTPPTCAPTEVESSERARQREIAAYLLASSFPLDMPAGPPGPQPILNPDPTLNALVQLGALRLNCRRSFVSLIDREHQYVVAEMTRTHAIGKVHHDPGDMISFGVCKLYSHFGVCPTTMKAFLDETGEWARQEPNHIANRTRYIVNDFRVAPEYRDRPYVTAFPWFVSYLEVPLFSPLGYLLGSYCVVHDDLREYDNDETVGIMNDIAAAIMDHLENKRIKQSRNRAEQLVGGLSAFIAAEPVETGQSQTASAHGSAVGIPQQSAESLGPAGQALGGINDAVSSPSHSSPSQEARPSPPVNMASSSSIESTFSTPSLPARSNDETPLTSLGSLAEEEASGGPLDQEIAERTADSVETPVSASPPLPGTSTPEIHASGFISSANIKSAFYRAAATIREAMNMDGLLFLDAVPSSFVGRSTHELGTGQADDDAAGPFCAEIVHSRADVVDLTSPPPPSRLPESILQRFILRFPRGHLFSADVFGPIDESYRPGLPYPGLHPDKDNQILREDVLALFRMLPTARYIIFLPLWHFQRECWYAAALCWVEEPTRAVDSTDVSLVAAFGNSIMAEVSRMETMAASRAKSSFVSSISHELRSPLHGILASSELLRESISDPSLLSTLDMLDSCGETLLDTFNNLLDHAIAIKDGSGTHAPAKKVQPADLDALVEEVVEAVHFSYQSEKAFQTSLQRRGVYSAQTPDVTVEGERPLLVMLNIAPAASWSMAVDVGAWKRIVMNIFGNALKYTKTGRIEVGLRIAPKLDREGRMRDHVCFTVEDTGRGMSSDYLKYRLFTPFSQEDSYSPGIGLGLSIIQQLTRGLGGSIDVKSSVGVGTFVEVCLPLDQSHATAPLLVPQKVVATGSVASNGPGRTACIVTADALAAAIKVDAPPVNTKTRMRAANVERAIRANASQGLEMQVVMATAQQPAPRADVYIVDADVLRAVAVTVAANDMTQNTYSPLVVLCSGIGSPQCLGVSDSARQATHLHHPLGPRKLFTAVSSALNSPAPPSQQEKNAQAAVPLQKQIAPPSEFVAEPLLAALPPPQTKPREEGVSFPAVPTSSASTPALSATLPSNSERYLLLVDDNPINIKLLIAVVRKLKHPYATAANGLEAVNLFRQSVEQGRRFDMVFMDISMPVMDGFEAIREIRRLEGEAGLEQKCRIAALTGLSGELSRKEALSSGGDAFLTKPIKLDTVRKLLDDLVENRAC